MSTTEAGAGSALNPEVSSEEVHALLGDEPGAQAVRPFALGAPVKPSVGRMPAFDRLNERWVKELCRELGARLRKPLAAAPQPVQLMPYADWQASVAPPSGLWVCTVPQWSRSAVIAIDGELLYLLVDGYFGGPGGAANRAGASLSRAEQRLGRSIAELAAALFAAAFEPFAKIALELAGAEEHPEFVNVARPAEAVAVVRVDVSLDGRGGVVSLVLPQSCLEPLRDRLAEGPREEAREPGRWREALVAGLAETELELASVLVETDITVRELLRLKPGDILPIEPPSTATLRVGAEPLLEGAFGVHRGTNAVSITGAASRPAEPAKGSSR